MCLALDRYRELTDKVDAFFARVAARHAADLRCAPGCAMCCHDRLTVTTVEADAIRAHVAAMPADARAALRATAETSTDACAALDAGGRCQIYAARPLVCRSHGVPIRTRARSLPVITSCSLNFTARGPAAADPDCVLDQETLSTILLALSPDGVRHDLAALLR
jgi:Fe-S-cluster containining protein